jgi:hypothetical protein
MRLISSISLAKHNQRGAFNTRKKRKTQPEPKTDSSGPDQTGISSRYVSTAKPFS